MVSRVQRLADQASAYAGVCRPTSIHLRQEASDDRTLNGMITARRRRRLRASNLGWILPSRPGLLSTKDRRIADPFGRRQSDARHVGLPVRWRVPTCTHPAAARFRARSPAPSLTRQTPPTPRSADLPGVGTNGSVRAQNRRAKLRCLVRWNTRVRTPASVIEAKLIRSWTPEPAASAGTQ